MDNSRSGEFDCVAGCGVADGEFDHWSIADERASGALAIKVFFLSCVIVAGVFGGFTANRKILLVQALPGAIALALVLLS